jgi:hypothetical protein
MFLRNFAFSLKYATYISQESALYNKNVGMIPTVKALKIIPVRLCPSQIQ